MSNALRNSFVVANRLALAGLLASALAACGGESPASLAQGSEALTSTTTTNFKLVSIDGNSTPPLLVCTANGTVDVNGGTLTVGSTTYTATFTGTDNGAPSTYTEKGKVSVSGNTYTFTAPGVGTFTGTLSNGTLTVSGYVYCGAPRTMVYQQQ